MKELWLKFKNEYGEPQSVRVSGENFIIGRSPDNDLSIPRSQLSRTHAEINRFSSSYVLSDCNSSNGTTLNGIDVLNPVELKNGDRINLGGGIEIQVELSAAGANNFEEDFADDFAGNGSALGQAALPQQDLPENQGAGDVAAAAATENPAVAAVATASAQPPKPAQPQGSPLKSLFIIAPILVIVILVFVGGIALILGGKKKEEPNNDDYIYTSRKDPETKRKPKYEDEDETPTPKSKETPGTTENNSTPSTPGSNSTADAPTPIPVSNDLDRLERSALPFMRRIAVNDDNYVFTQKQLGEINNQVKSFKGSSSLRSNLKAVKSNAAKFEELAKSKGLKPQFLATAALAKIGNQTQDPLTVAQTMLPILGELKITLGNELSDENLLIIAAYNFGEQQQYRALQTTLEVLAKQSPGVAANKIRTVWYLREKGKLTDSQYNFVMRFLAIGAITQNPKDFNVDTDAVTF